MSYLCMGEGVLLDVYVSNVCPSGGTCLLYVYITLTRLSWRGNVFNISLGHTNLSVLGEARI